MIEQAAGLALAVVLDGSAAAVGGAGLLTARERDVFQLAVVVGLQLDPFAPLDGAGSEGGDTGGVEIYRYVPGVTGLAMLEWSYEGAAK